MAAPHSPRRGGNRPPAFNVEAERSVLGSVLLDDEELYSVAIFLQARDFYNDAHRLIYTAIRELHDSGKRVDAVSLADELKRRNQFEQVGGDEMLTEICESVPHAANCEFYADIVKAKARDRHDGEFG
jgi:replicative DNA helicase